jgi:GNAT superfamily N-acetyltransferase
LAGYDYRVAGTSADELGRVAELLRLVFPETAHTDVEYLRWLYASNPSGELIGVNAWDGETLAGHYALIPIRAELQRQPVDAALSLNTAVHPSHQGRGLFTELAERTYQLAAERGAHHVIGVANAQSTPGFLRRLAFQHVGPLEALLLWRAPVIEREAAQQVPSWRRVWEPAHLRWRVGNPATRYTLCRRRGRCLLLAPTGRAGIRAILKAEIDSGESDLGTLGLPERASVGPLLWLGTSRRIRRAALGAVQIPRRLRPSPLNVIFRSLEAPGETIDAATLEFEAIDFDAY